MPSTVVAAVTVKAPACEPASRVMRATPLESVNAVPDEGTKTPVLSVVVKVTAALGTALPLLSLTVARSDPARSGETEVIDAPDASASESVTAATVVAEVEVPVALPPGFNELHSVEIVLTQDEEESPPPPPHALRPSAINTAQALILICVLVFTPAPCSV